MQLFLQISPRVGLTNEPLQFSVKCNPKPAVELREQYGCKLSGYHMNKQHWNTVIIDNTLGIKQLKEQIDHSYELVSKGKKRRKIKNDWK